MRAVALLLSIALAGLVWVGADAASAEQDEALFQGLIPGDALTEGELAEFNGRGLTTSGVTQIGSESSSSDGPVGRNLRAILMGAFKRAGVRPPLAPSGPNGTSGGGPIQRGDMIKPLKIEIPRVKVPSLPRMGSGSGSSSGSRSISSF